MRKKLNADAKLDRLQKRYDFIANELRAIEEMEKDLQCVLWKKFEGKSAEEYDVLEDKLFNYEKLSDREIIMVLAARKQIVKAISVKNYIASKPKFEEELVGLREQIRDLKDKHK